MRHKYLICATVIFFILLLKTAQVLYAGDQKDLIAERLFAAVPVKQFDTASVRMLVVKGSDMIWANPDSAMFYFRQAEQASLSAGFIDGVIIAQLNIGHAYASRGAYQLSFFSYKMAELYAYYTADRTIPARIYTDIATTYLMQSDYPHAAEYFYKAFKTQKDHGMSDKPNILFTYANLAYLQSTMGQYELAIDYLDQAESLALAKQYYGQLGFILNNKGEAYASLGKPEEAFRCYTQGLDYCRKGALSKNQRAEIEQSLLISLGSLMIEQNKPQDAIGYLNRAMQLSASTSPYYTDIFPRYQLGYAYYALKDYRNAEHMLSVALARARKLKFKEDMPEALLTLSKVYEATGEPTKALEQYKAYTRLRDSLMNLAKIQSVRQFESRYYSAQKDKELTEKKLLISKQQNQLMRKNTLLLIFSLSGLLLLALSLLLLLRYRTIQHSRRLQAERLQTIAKEMELVAQEKDILQKEEKIKIFQALVKGEEKERQRIARELHDGIGGMLAAIQMQFSALMSGSHKDDRLYKMNKIMQLLENTSMEVRGTAHNLMPDVVLNHNLHDALQLFCAGITQSGVLHIDLQTHNLSAVFDKSTELCIYRIVQELVQNIIKHSFANEAAIQVTQQEHMLYIFAEDNGIGFDTSVQRSGLGLQNLNSRVQSLHGSMSIDSSPGKGTTCYIELDLSTTTLQSV